MLEKISTTLTSQNDRTKNLIAYRELWILHFESHYVQIGGGGFEILQGEGN